MYWGIGWWGSHGEGPNYASMSINLNMTIGLSSDVFYLYDPMRYPCDLRSMGPCGALRARADGRWVASARTDRQVDRDERTDGWMCGQADGLLDGWPWQWLLTHPRLFPY